MGVTVLAAHNLVKRYGRFTAVDHVDLSIERGELVGFLGPNGAGKTTTLRMLAGLIRPTSGSAEVLGGPVPGPGLRRVGTMIEEPSFYPYLSGRDNLRYASLLHGDITEQRIDEVLAFVRMENAAQKKVRAYSQGMRQRLGLARALLHKPDILLLDEPTNGLDPVGIAEIRENLRTVAQQGVTVLISSHILSELEKLVTRVVAIERGSIRYDGSLRGLVSRMEERVVMVRIEATDAEKLRSALQDDAVRGDDVSLHLSSGPEGLTRVELAHQAIPDLLRRLLNHGVDVTEVHAEGDDLEGAYLRLLQEDGRPS